MCTEAVVVSNTYHVYLCRRANRDSRRAVPAVAHLRSNHQYRNPVYDSLWLKSKAPGERLVNTRNPVEHGT